MLGERLPGLVLGGRCSPGPAQIVRDALLLDFPVVPYHFSRLPPVPQTVSLSQSEHTGVRAWDRISWLCVVLENCFPSLNLSVLF